jgi:hypothetical protein
MQRVGRLSSLFVIAALLPALVGMGIGGGQGSIQPDVDFHATVTDKDGTKVELSRVNVGGQVKLSGELGRGNLRIAFADIERIEFANEARDRTMAAVQLKNGERIHIKVRHSLTFAGQTAVGLYEVRARDLERVEFNHK